MVQIFNYRSTLVTTLLLALSYLGLAQQKNIEQVWYNQEKTAKIQIYKGKDNKYYGKIIWLKEPEKNGRPKVDDKNPDAAKKNQPILGLQVLKGFEYDEDDVYEDGSIYDPKNGKTYSCKITHKGNKLEVRGYVGISLIGRTAVWTLAE